MKPTLLWLSGVKNRHFTLCTDSDSCHLFPVRKLKKNICSCDLLYCDFIYTSKYFFWGIFLDIFWALSIHAHASSVLLQVYFIFHCFEIILSVFGTFPDCRHKGLQTFSTMSVELSQWVLKAAEAEICRVLYLWLRFLLLTFTDEFCSRTVRNWLAVPYVLN